MGSTYFGFAQTSIYDFQNTVLIRVALSSTNATKSVTAAKRVGKHAQFAYFDKICIYQLDFLFR